MSAIKPTPWTLKAFNADLPVNYKPVDVEFADGSYVRISESGETGTAKLMRAAPEMREALKQALKLIEALMPGVRHIALQDYRALNETPLEIERLLKETQL